MIALHFQVRCVTVSWFYPSHDLCLGFKRTPKLIYSDAEWARYCLSASNILINSLPQVY